MDLTGEEVKEILAELGTGGVITEEDFKKIFAEEANPKKSKANPKKSKGEPWEGSEETDLGVGVLVVIWISSCFLLF